MIVDSSKALKINNVELTFQKSNPPTLVINAEGDFPNPSYHNARLIPHVYIGGTPPDGILTFDMVADSNGSPSIQPIDTLKATYILKNVNEKIIKAVKVVGITNELLQKIESTQQITGTVEGGIGPTPFSILANKEQFIVLENINTKNLIIAAADSMYIQIYRKVYGPNTQDACQAWINNNKKD